MRQFQRAPRGYELMTLINPELADEALTTEVDYVSGLITSFGGEITLIKRDTPWGRRRLAYPIQRFRDATYVLFQFQAPPSILTDVERDLKLDERVIRYLLVRYDPPAVTEEEVAAEGEAATEGSVASDETPAVTDVESPAAETSQNEVESSSSDAEESAVEAAVGESETE